MALSCSGFKTIALLSRRIFKSDNALVNSSAIFWFCFDEKICSVSRNSPKGNYQNIWLTGEHCEPIGTIRTLAYGPTQKSPPSVQAVFQLLPPQSPRGFSALASLHYLATKTAMLRRLMGSDLIWSKHPVGRVTLPLIINKFNIFTCLWKGLLYLLSVI